MRRSLRYLRQLGAAALLRMGIEDSGLIAELVELPPREVERLTSSPGPRVRVWMRLGFPPGEFAELSRPVRCRGCGALIDKVPCLGCTLEPSRRNDQARISR